MSEFKSNNSTEFLFASNLAQGFTVVPNPVMNDMPRMGSDAFAVLIKLFQYANANGHKTTVRGLAKLTGVSINKTGAAINKLIELGYIVRSPKYVGNLIHGYTYEVYDRPVENTRCHEGRDNDTSDTEYGDNKKENGLKNKGFKKENKDVDDVAEKILNLYKPFKIEKRITPHMGKLIRENASRFSEDVWEYIFIQASEDSVAKKYNYIKELISDFTKNKIYSLSDLEGYNAKYKESKQKAKSSPKEKRPLTRFHNINQRFDKYTPEELEKILKENQKIKFAREEAARKQRSSFHNFNETFTQYSEEELNDAITKSQEAKYGKPQATPENPADFVVTEEIYQDALRDWSKYRIVQKIMIRDYAKANDRFIPGFWKDI